MILIILWLLVIIGYGSMLIILAKYIQKQNKNK